MRDRKFVQTTNNLGSVMKHDFSKVPAADIPRSSFNRSHTHKTTFNAGYLIPVFVDEVLPGDTFNVDATFFARMATPLAPIMDNLFLDSFFFFVPNRLVWDNWEKQNGSQVNPGDSTDYVEPQLVITPAANPNTGQTLFDYMGIPYCANNISVSALPFRAHNLIYNEWFRDQNLQDSLTVETDDGPDTIGNYSIQRRGKRHDYFTSALPWPQKGDAVLLPLGTTAPVVFSSAVISGTSSVSGPVTGALDGALGNLRLDVTGQILQSQNVAVSGAQNASISGTSSFNQDAMITGYADLSSATAATINAIRFAFQMQKLLERDARGGTRYTEILRSHFGVVSPDSRLQRPEYLGGGETPVNIHPVAATAVGASGGNANYTPNLGDLGGYGTAVSHHGHNHGFTKSFVEHGWVIGYVSVRADLTYQQGVERMWFRQTRFDRYWPVFASLGEQSILNQEIYVQGTSADTAVFGYQEAWAEYRYKPSRISGLFRSSVPDALDSWHLAQDFTSLPTLGSTFIQDTPPMGRVEAFNATGIGWNAPVDGSNVFADFIFDSYFKFVCARPMPVYSVPGLVDHF